MIFQILIHITFPKLWVALFSLFCREGPETLGNLAVITQLARGQAKIHTAVDGWNLSLKHMTATLVCFTFFAFHVFSSESKMSLSVGALSSCVPVLVV